MIKISKKNDDDDEEYSESVQHSMVKCVAGLGCIALAFYGYEHNYEGSGWLVFVGVLFLFNLLD